MHHSEDFTFHYGSIQISLQADHLPGLRSLHSTMVLFKSCTAVFIETENQTLHSTMVLFKCDVLTHLAYVISTLHSTMVLFKYEYRVLVSSYEYLYIPLWFYSNLILSCVFDCLLISLHSTMVLFKSFLRTETSTSSYSLHSTMVLFKLRG